MTCLIRILGNLFLVIQLVAAFPTSSAQTDGPSKADTRALAAYSAVPNGQEWYDTDGNPIWAFGGNYYEEDSTYYWVGQNKPSLGLQSSDEPAMINLYKSSDFLNWEKVGAIITVYTPDVEGKKKLAWCKLERPKLMKSEVTGKYVIWIHYETGNSYSASEVIIFTASKLEGPWQVTEKGHHRPGEGYESESAMGDRVGGLRPDYSSQPIDSADSSIAFAPVQHSYPPSILQYGNPTTQAPYNPDYVSAATYGTLSLTGVRFNVTMKAIAVEMTPWNATIYDRYKGSHKISTANYIVRYPTDARSRVSSRDIRIGIPEEPGSSSNISIPIISPTRRESESSEVVWVNTGDAAFLTLERGSGDIYYTTDGSEPATTSTKYVSGTRISVVGEAGDRLTIKAIAVENGKTSEMASETYEIAADKSKVPIFEPVFNFPSGTYERDGPLFQTGVVRIYSPSYMSNVYYTLDGDDPDPPKPGYNLGYGSRDMTVWKDPASKKSYLVTATDNVHMRIWELSKDLTDVVPENEYDVFVDESREAPTLVRNKGASGEYVYLLTSAQTGWYPNQAQYVRTNSFEDGFTLPRNPTSGYRNGRKLWSDLSPAGDTTTYGSQPTWILNFGTDSNPTYVYIGDRHNPTDLIHSTHVVTPMYLDDETTGVGGVEGAGNLTISFMPLPVIDVAKGTIHQPTSKLISRKKPVTASPARALTSAEAASGTYNYNASVANDGFDFDINRSDTINQFYYPVSVPYFWQVDLGGTCELAWAGITFRSISGSDSVSLHTISGSQDNKTWTELVDNSVDKLPGYKSHLLEGSYRYIRLDVSSVYDVVHSTTANWQVGLYEMNINGNC